MVPKEGGREGRGSPRRGIAKEDGREGRGSPRRMIAQEKWSRGKVFALDETRDILLSLGSSLDYIGPKTSLASDPTPIPCSSNHPCGTSRANIAGNLEVCELVVRGSMV